MRHGVDQQPVDRLLQQTARARPLNDAVDEPLHRAAPGALSFERLKEIVPVGRQQLGDDRQAARQAGNSLGLEQGAGEVAGDEEILALRGEEGLAEGRDLVPVDRRAARERRELRYLALYALELGRVAHLGARGRRVVDGALANIVCHGIPLRFV